MIHEHETTHNFPREGEKRESQFVAVDGYAAIYDPARRPDVTPGGRGLERWFSAYLAAMPASSRKNALPYCALKNLCALPRHHVVPLSRSQHVQFAADVVASARTVVKFPMPPVARDYAKMARKARARGSLAKG